MSTNFIPVGGPTGLSDPHGETGSMEPVICTGPTGPFDPRMLLGQLESTPTPGPAVCKKCRHYRNTTPERFDWCAAHHQRQWHPVAGYYWTAPLPAILNKTGYCYLYKPNWQTRILQWLRGTP
jgi:hypothetical protein